MTRWPVDLLTFSKKSPSRANGRSTYIHPPSLAKIRQRTSEEIGNKHTNTQTNAARIIVWCNLNNSHKRQISLNSTDSNSTKFWLTWQTAQIFNSWSCGQACVHQYKMDHVSTSISNKYLIRIEIIWPWMDRKWAADNVIQIMIQDTGHLSCKSILLALTFYTAPLYIICKPEFQIVYITS